MARIFVFVVLFSLTCTAFASANPAQLSTLEAGAQKSKTTTYRIGYYTFQKGSCLEILKVVPKGMPSDHRDGVEVHRPVSLIHCRASQDAELIKLLYFKSKEICSALYRETGAKEKEFFVIVPLSEEQQIRCKE